MPIHTASGNPTWENYPSTNTLVTAGTLENIENVLDALVTRPFFRIDLTTNYSNSAGADILAQTGWTIRKDTHSGGFASGATGTYSTYTIPVANRLWDIYLDLYTSTQGTNSGFAGKVLRNATAVPNIDTGTACLATDFVETLSSVENHVKCYRLGVPLDQGDVLRWGSWSSIAVTVRSNTFGRPSSLVIRDAGPA